MPCSVIRTDIEDRALAPGGPWRPLGSIVELTAGVRAAALARAGAGHTHAPHGRVASPLLLELAAQLGGFLAQATWLRSSGTWSFPFLLFVEESRWELPVAAATVVRIEAVLRLITPHQARVDTTVASVAGTCLTARLGFAAEAPEEGSRLDTLRSAAQQEWTRLGVSFRADGTAHLAGDP